MVVVVVVVVVVVGSNHWSCMILGVCHDSSISCLLEGNKGLELYFNVFLFLSKWFKINCEDIASKTECLC